MNPEKNCLLLIEINLFVLASTHWLGDLSRCHQEDEEKYPESCPKHNNEGCEEGHEEHPYIIHDND